MKNIKIPLSLHEKLSIGLTTITIAVGYTISLFSTDDIFSRSGAIIVCIGVYFGMKGLTQFIDPLMEVSDEVIDMGRDHQVGKMYEIPYIRELKNKYGADAEEHPVIKARKKEINEIMNEAKEHIRQEGASLKNRLIKIEGGTLILGTLIWGFGDLLVISTPLSGMLFK